jgi:hypothetical protein
MECRLAFPGGLCIVLLAGCAFRQPIGYRHDDQGARDN